MQHPAAGEVPRRPEHQAPRQPSSPWKDASRGGTLQQRLEARSPETAALGSPARRGRLPASLRRRLAPLALSLRAGQSLWHRLAEKASNQVQELAMLTGHLAAPEMTQPRKEPRRWCRR